MSSTGSSKKPISERFCTSDHDVVLKASDGMHFHFYRKNLKVHSEGMLPTGDATEQSTAEPETISLEESSETIDLLLQFMLRQNQPTLQNVSFSAVLALAEAAEKYRVYSVVAPCQVHMREILPQNSLEILAYAGKHRHAELADLAAVPTIKSSLKAVVESLSTISLDLVVSWVPVPYPRGKHFLITACLFKIRYRETWNDAFIHAQESLRMRFSQCYGGCRSAGTLSLHFKGQLGSLLGMDDIFVSVIQNDCRYCSPGLVAWKNEVMMTVKKLAAFSTHSKTWFANRIDGRALEDGESKIYY
ncbi:hypothetical protein PLICRDRAFT_335235 [Plicaturopsis crispa FD-325 SS-3]|uniref:BTB domain-containing protein n=1 Tax=Plicaturopsis crispa FD-325 SS-3 TaxID=944288 RepID=A0A0C9SLB5_PLICR|nr:hypothetical protein PLICRDRAFT_335235 [Plicaturopsis crispa FD-325 SS-3]